MEGVDIFYKEKYPMFTIDDADRSLPNKMRDVYDYCENFLNIISNAYVEN
jgi:hypothetical protein